MGGGGGGKGGAPWYKMDALCNMPYKFLKLANPKGGKLGIFGRNFLGEATRHFTVILINSREN